MTDPIEEYRPDYMGDGYDPEPLLTADQVGEILGVPRDSVYDMEIPRIRMSSNRVRYRPADVRDWIANRMETE